MSWFKKLREKLNIKESLRKVKPKARRIAVSFLALALVLAMVFGLNVRSPLPSAGLPAEALAEAGQSFKKD